MAEQKTKSCFNCSGQSIVKDCSSGTSQPICEDCGCLQKDVAGLSHEREFSAIGCGNYQSFYKLDLPASAKRGSFLDIFKSYCAFLNMGKNLYNQAEIHLVALYKYLKKNTYQVRVNHIAALLYLIHRHNDVVFSISQFARRLQLDKFRLALAVREVNRMLNLFSVECRLLIRNIESHIDGLVPVIFKPPIPKFEKQLKEYGCRLATIIIRRQWYGTRSSCDSKIAGVSVLIAAQCLTNCNRKKVNARRVCQHLNVCLREIEKYTTFVKQKLFEVASRIPWKPSTIDSYMKVPIMLADILKHVEILEDDWDQTCIDNAAEDIRKLPEDLLMIITGSVKENLTSTDRVPLFNALGKINAASLQQVVDRYLKVLLDYQQSKDSELSNNEQSIDFELEEVSDEDRGQPIENMCDYLTCDTVSIGGPTQGSHVDNDPAGVSKEVLCCNIKLLCNDNGVVLADDTKACLSHSELKVIEDLLKAGCPDDDILVGNYLHLSRLYLDHFSDKTELQADGEELEA